jgi:peptide/nickel transport system ATP-binding protein
MLLNVTDLSVDFHVGRGGSLRKQHQILRAVDRVSLEMAEHETLGIVGESGSGKSTTARAITGLAPISSGSVRFDGKDLTALSRREMKAVRRDMQMVFQDPYSSLDPSWLIEDVVGEPLDVHQRDLSKGERKNLIVEALHRVGLEPHHLARYPQEFSGGQRQRIAIARALVVKPKFILFDEAVSALDVSTQSQVVNLIKRIQADLGTAYFFIAHDLTLVRYVSDRMAVMYLGQIVESGRSEQVFDTPTHPYTEALLSAVRNPYVPKLRERIVLQGEIPSPIDPPSGCRFHTRCPYAMDLCSEVEPTAFPLPDGGVTACHLHTTGPELRGASLLGLSPDDASVRAMRSSQATASA